MERHRTLAEALDQFNKAWDNLASLINEKNKRGVRVIRRIIILITVMVCGLLLLILEFILSVIFAILSCVNYIVDKDLKITDYIFRAANWTNKQFDSLIGNIDE